MERGRRRGRVGRREVSMFFGVSSYNDINPIMSNPPSGSHLTLLISQRSHWRLGLQHMYGGERDANIEFITPSHDEVMDISCGDQNPGTCKPSSNWTWAQKRKEALSSAQDFTNYSNINAEWGLQFSNVQDRMCQKVWHATPASTWDAPAPHRSKILGNSPVLMNTSKALRSRQQRRLLNSNEPGLYLHNWVKDAVST